VHRFWAFSILGCVTILKQAVRDGFGTPGFILKTKQLRRRTTPKSGIIDPAICVAGAPVRKLLRR